VIHLKIIIIKIKLSDRMFNHHTFFGFIPNM